MHEVGQVVAAALVSVVVAAVSLALILGLEV